MNQQLQREALIRKRVLLVERTTNLPVLMNYLLPSYTLTNNHIENINCEPTSMGKNSKLYDILSRRGPDMFNHLLAALDASGNGFIADELRSFCGIKKEVVVPCPFEEEVQSSEDVFGALCQEVGGIRPVSTTNERSNNPVYKVSVTIYQNDLPTIKTGQAELPYVMAIYKGIPKHHVLKWPGCPAACILDKSFTIYKAEVESAKRVLKAIGSGGLDVRSDCNILKALLVLEEHDARINIESVCLDDMSPADANWLSMMFHLIFYGANTSFVIRKDFNPKPSSYLLYNVRKARSDVILDAHRSIVGDFVGEDESQLPQEKHEYACPFLRADDNVYQEI